MKPVVWIKSSQKDFKKLPVGVQRKMAFAIDLASNGLTSGDAGQMKGDLREVTEIRVNGQAGTYRTMYTTRIGSKVYVLHAFQKKSTQGIETPKRDLDLIRKRLKEARELAKAEAEDT